ncbi:MAG: fluoride efflux transporter CrcB [Acidobacteriia bacterium]|nr:fluoride efflux transporter CrcB [Terriglobia bacterium]
MWRPGVFCWAQWRAESGPALRIFLLIVFGSAGTLARYALQGWVQDQSGPSFPAGTLAVNVIGSFLLGCIGQFALDHLWVSPEWRVAITIGFFGAFTTFSSFGWETAHLLDSGEWMRAAIYAGASVLGGIVAVMLGMRLAERI